jgi:hypothetical protein
VAKFSDMEEEVMPKEEKQPNKYWNFYEKYRWYFGFIAGFLIGVSL